MNVFTHAIVLAENGGGEQATSNPLGSLIPFLLIGVLFYFLIIRPQRKRQQEQQAMLRRVNIGDEIVTIGGLHGTIVSLDDDTMELSLAQGVVVTMARSAISKTLTEPAEIDFDDDFDDFDDDELDEFDEDVIGDEYGEDEYVEEDLEGESGDTERDR